MQQSACEEALHCMLEVDIEVFKFIRQRYPLQVRGVREGYDSAGVWDHEIHGDETKTETGFVYEGSCRSQSVRPVSDA